jgi:amino acid transporter
MAIACLTFLQVSSDSSVVLDWFINISTASQLVNWMSMAFTYTRFYKATNHAGMDRSKLPVKSWCQPYGAWYALVCAAIVSSLSMMSQL